MYISTFEHTRDAKGRIFVPARYRETLGEEFVLFRSPDKCIFIYDYEEFQKIVDQVKEKSRTAEEREKQRNFFDAAYPVTMDKQGRFTMPQEFAKYASLETNIVIKGRANRMEIWSKEVLDARGKAPENLTEADFPDVSY